MPIPAAAPAARVATDAWLGGVLGKPAYRLHVGDDVSADSVRDVLTSAVGPGPSFVDAKVPVERVEAVRALTESGFALIDTNVVLDLRDAPLTGQTAAGMDIRDAAAGDAHQVATVARESFTFSRFHLDPQVPTAVADEIKAQWVANYFAGARGDALAVAVDASGPCGFLLALTPPDEVVIDLIAVASRARRQRLGAALISHVWQRFLPARMIVGTQVANVGSLRFYETAGFRMSRAAYVLHRHGT